MGDDAVVACSKDKAVNYWNAKSPPFSFPLDVSHYRQHTVRFKSKEFHKTEVKYFLTARRSLRTIERQWDNSIAK